MGEFSGSAEQRMVERVAEECGKDLVHFLARRVRTVMDAQDLAQEAYVRLLRLDRKDLIRDPRSYLFRIASNVLYEFELKRKARLAGLSRWTDDRRTDGEDGTTLNEGETLVLRERLELVMSELSPKCRAVLILHRREGMTYEEIGAQLNISTSMVKKYLSKGIRHCRERLQDFR